MELIWLRRERIDRCGSWRVGLGRPCWSDPDRAISISVLQRLMDGFQMGCETWWKSEQHLNITLGQRLARQSDVRIVWFKGSPGYGQIVVGNQIWQIAQPNYLEIFLIFGIGKQVQMKKVFIK